MGKGLSVARGAQAVAQHDLITLSQRAGKQMHVDAFSPNGHIGVILRMTLSAYGNGKHYAGLPAFCHAIAGLQRRANLRVAKSLRDLKADASARLNGRCAACPGELNGHRIADAHGNGKNAQPSGCFGMMLKGHSQHLLEDATIPL